MGECRFDGTSGGCYIHIGGVGQTSKHPRPALCTHAAADLERRVKELHSEVGYQHSECEIFKEEAEHVLQRLLLAETRCSKLAIEAATCRQQTHEAESRLTRLEEGKAQLAKDDEQIVRDLLNRLAQAEARAAAMREKLEQLQRSIKERKFGKNADTARHAYQLEVIEAALSPDAGHAPGGGKVNINEVLDSISDRVALQPDTFTKARVALDDYRLLAAEVEKLREVANYVADKHCSTCELESCPLCELVEATEVPEAKT